MKRDIIGTGIIIALGLFLLPGCAGKTQKQFMNEMRVTIENSVVANEPCNITCGKIKNIVARYKEKLK